MEDDRAYQFEHKIQQSIVFFTVPNDVGFSPLIFGEKKKFSGAMIWFGYTKAKQKAGVGGGVGIRFSGTTVSVQIAPHLWLLSVVSFFSTHESTWHWIFLA